MVVFFFFFQAEDGIRDLVRSRGLGDVYKRQVFLDRFKHRAIQVHCLVKIGEYAALFDRTIELQCIPVPMFVFRLYYGHCRFAFFHGSSVMPDRSSLCFQFELVALKASCSVQQCDPQSLGLGLRSMSA